ncbi:MAG: shikimate kinase [Gemmatimonadaceae bacterium]
MVLVGLPGVGKSTVGAEAARRLRRPFVDLDEQIERLAGQRVHEIFATRGEAFFRSLETAATHELLSQPSSIVAPGGGWIERPENTAIVAGRALVVYLKASPAVALRRAEQDETIRPLLVGSNPEARIAALFERRSALYDAADHTIDTEVLTTEEVVKALMELILRPGAL